MSRKLLIREVFEKGKRESGKDSKNGISLYLWAYFDEKLNFDISEKTLVRYNDAFLRDNKDVKIDTFTLDKMSQYLEFKDYKDFCKSETFTKINDDSSLTKVKVSIDKDEESLTEKLSQIVVNITTTPIFKIPEFLSKHSNMGILGIVLSGSLVVGSKMYKADEKTAEKTTIQDSAFQNQVPTVENANTQTVVYVPQSLVSIPTGKENIPKIAFKQCMSWDGKEYVPQDCGSTENGLVAIDMKMVDNFKRITTPDTIRSIKNIWYSKHQNVVEFFTADGVNPENGKELHPVTNHIFEKYLN